MSDLLDLADRLWRGEETTDGSHPFAPTGEFVEVADGTRFLSSFANVSAFSTGEGLVLVDTGSPFSASFVHEQVRKWTDAPLHTAVFSHGHIDHVFGVGAFEEEGRARPPRVVAHAAMPARFDRYRLTAGWNTAINRRQFSVDDPDFAWPTTYRYPDVTYDRRLDLTVGEERFELHHARGETDDHTWTWVPGRKVLCSGDLFIWCVPNAGNPQKVQRYPAEWAIALRTMAGLGAEVLLPGHGLPILGAARIRQALEDSAALLESIHDQTLALMNEGARLDEILHRVEPPAGLLERPYLRPVYDDPEFIVRTVWRLYGGWYDGNPSRLLPAPDRDVAAEVAQLAGGAIVLADRAARLREQGHLRLAGHLAEWATQAAEADPDVHRVRAEVYEARRDAEPSTMAKGIFGSAARESRDRLER